MIVASSYITLEGTSVCQHVLPEDGQRPVFVKNIGRRADLLSALLLK